MSKINKSQNSTSCDYYVDDQSVTKKITSSNGSTKFQRLSLSSTSETVCTALEYILGNQVLITETNSGDDEERSSDELSQILSDVLTPQEEDEDNESDLDIDVEEWINKEKYELAEDIVGDKKYIDICNKTGVIPSAYFLRHLDNYSFRMRYYGLGPLGAKAISVPLKTNVKIHQIDLEGNCLEDRGAFFLANMLKDNVYITELYLAENKIGTSGAIIMAKMLKENFTVTVLDLSGNGIEDDGAACICDTLLTNTALKRIYLRNNLFEEQAATCFRDMLCQNESLVVLDLSWNRFRTKAAACIADGIRENVGLRSLNLSMNGLALEGAESMGTALKVNRTLLHLDITFNRIPEKGATHIASGLVANDMLETLHIGHNPLSADGAMSILAAVNSNMCSSVIELSVENIPVTAEFEELQNRLESERQLKLVHGGVISRRHSTKFDPIAAFRRDPMTKLKQYIEAAGYRMIDLFKNMDKDGNMCITREEFMRGIKHVGVTLTDEQIDVLLSRFDKDDDGVIDWSEMMKGEQEYRQEKITVMAMNDKKDDGTDK